MESKDQRFSAKEFVIPVLPNEDEIRSHFSPDIARYVDMRMNQEMLSIERERARVIQAMDDQLVYTKQRLLYNLCGKMQDFANNDAENLGIYKKMCPELFTRFVQKGTRKKLRKKPKMQKITHILDSLEQPLPRIDALLDISCTDYRPSPHQNTDNSSAIMHTKKGMKWIVNKKILEGSVAQVTYCDGSRSLLSPNDIRAIHVNFEPYQ